ncbi:MAG: molybdopterin-guanine dinucleotide biosynthesis protein A [Arenicella sp.]|jgi:molybdopterin-guanine dinucleotide biosynthesis protein A
MTCLDKNTTAIILSGGAGKRLNGSDKGLQSYKGKRLVEHVIDAISPQVGTLYICANRNLVIYETLGFKVLSDQHEHYQGPMSGISTALKVELLDSECDTVLISSCDAPHLPHDLRQRLELGFSNSSDADVSVAHDGDRRQNLHCLIRRKAWQSLIDFFDTGGRAMHRWFAEVDVVEVDFSDDINVFLNINTSKQLCQSNTLAKPLA